MYDNEYGDWAGREPRVVRSPLPPLPPLPEQTNQQPKIDSYESDIIFEDGDEA